MDHAQRDRLAQRAASLNEENVSVTTEVNRITSFWLKMQPLRKERLWEAAGQAETKQKVGCENYQDNIQNLCRVVSKEAEWVVGRTPRVRVGWEIDVQVRVGLKVLYVAIDCPNHLMYLSSSASILYLSSLIIR